ncbi:putative RNase H-like nuclease [Saccharothrix tamanrassetensis]|uniref:Putative RNase H-like nuclease n=1 Tax=Saccharothrix tamanrassetensis TaxID=1051531 RepID=A0A841CNG6_9PSEU|nr:DUF429 domain-containing protein [Saccharothrix tamanrassetensis]MBB5957678.1 putative RNase H-like nuclease [Saccharothrix tamanrassetensis]
MIAGVDGTPGGWVVALVASRARVRWHRVASAAEVVQLTAGCDAVGVDMPLRPPATGYRACDVRARELLGAARSSMFFAPVRAVLGCATYAEACEVSRASHGKAISKQAWHIVAKIREWQLELPSNVVEVHPETTFRVLDPRVTDSKRSTRGVAQRLIALRAFVDVPDVLADLPVGPSVDDVLDALAAAWSAARWSTGESRSLGDPPALIEV